MSSKMPKRFQDEGAADADDLAAVAEEESPSDEHLPPGHGYVRKADVLRARYLSAMEALDFSGLFIGNLGSEVLDSQRRRRPAQPVDPSHITDLLLRGNGCRRRGAHAEALVCYQELVELDPENADFRFLLNTTYQALRTEGPPPADD